MIQIYKKVLTLVHSVIVIIAEHMAIVDFLFFLFHFRFEDLGDRWLFERLNQLVKIYSIKVSEEMLDHALFEVIACNPED